MVWMSYLPEQNSPDIITTELTAGTTYTFEVSKNLADPMGGRIPDVKIFDPYENAVETVLTLYPEEQPSMILYTFTPSVSGTYTAEICNANENSESATDCVLFVYKELHNYTGENGYYARFIINDAEGEAVGEASAVDIIQLRKNFLATHPYYLNEVYGKANDNGSLSRNNKNGEDVNENLEEYNKWQDIMKSSVGIVQVDDPEAAADDDDVSASLLLASPDIKSGDVKSPDKIPIIPTQIDATVYDVPYESIYQLGAGFMATTNLQPYSDVALEEFKLPVPANRSLTTRFTYSFISSKEDYENKMGKNFSMGLTRSALGVSGSVQSTNNLKFGLTSTTLVIHYEEMEHDYRQLALSQYKPTEDALEIAGEGSEMFREEFGDYFVAGYQYGGMYDAYVSITTETSDQLEKVKLQLGAQLKAMEKVGSGDNAKEVLKTSADLKFSQESQEILKKNKAQITVEIRTIGAGATTPQISNLPNSKDISAMGSLVDGLTEFRNNLANSFNPNNYVPVNVLFKRYRSLSALRKKIDPTIPVDANHSANIMSFNRELVGMRGYYNVIAGLPNDRIDTSIRDEYTRKFDEIINPIRAAGNNFYASADRIADALPKVRELSKELKTIGDRYAFYTMLMDAQDKESGLKGSSVKDQPFGANRGSTGYKSFGVSAAVTDDLNKGGSYSKSSPTDTNAWKKWSPILEAGEDRRFAWLRVTAPHENDNKRDLLTPPAVGKQKASFSFESAFTTARVNGDWKIESQTIYMLYTCRVRCIRSQDSRTKHYVISIS